VSGSDGHPAVPSAVGAATAGASNRRFADTGDTSVFYPAAVRPHVHHSAADQAVWVVPPEVIPWAGRSRFGRTTDAVRSWPDGALGRQARASHSKSRSDYLRSLSIAVALGRAATNPGRRVVTDSSAVRMGPLARGVRPPGLCHLSPGAATLAGPRRRNHHDSRSSPCYDEWPIYNSLGLSVGSNPRAQGLPPNEPSPPARSRFAAHSAAPPCCTLRRAKRPWCSPKSRASVEGTAFNVEGPYESCAAPSCLWLPSTVQRPPRPVVDEAIVRGVSQSPPGPGTSLLATLTSLAP